MNLWTQLRLRPRLLVAVATGSLLAALWPLPVSGPTRLLIGWNLAVWLYVVLVVWMMLAGQGAAHVQQRARRLAEGVPVVLVLAILGALASLAAITLELQAARQSHQAGHLLLTLATVCGSWLLLPVEFALAYASIFHRPGQATPGLQFPGDDGPPDYGDFLYFSITLAATAQTSDVAISSRPMRRLVLLQTLLAFAFNTGVLALAINILAGLLS